jgi:hypothetical protein
MGDLTDLTAIERLVLVELEHRPDSTCTEIGDRVFASRSPAGASRRPQVWARPAGSVLHRLRLSGYAAWAWNYAKDDGRRVWRITGEGSRALARAKEGAQP